MAGPIIRWAGSKRQYLNTLVNFVGHEPNRYIEPFCGFASVFFNISPRAAVLADVNNCLINFYEVIKEAAEHVYDIFFRCRGIGRPIIRYVNSSLSKVIL